MSMEKAFSEFSIFSRLLAQGNYPYDNYHNFENPNSAFYQNLEITSTSTVELLKKNGTQENEIKSGINYFHINCAKDGEPISNLTMAPRNLMINTLDPNSSEFYQENINYSKENLMEPEPHNFIDLGGSNQNPRFKNNSKNTNQNKNLHFQIPHEIPLISSLFKIKYNRENNNISSYVQKKRFTPIIKPEPTKFSSPKAKSPNNQNIKNDFDLKVNPINPKHLESQKKESYDLNIPEDFLTIFHLKEINSKNLLFNDIQGKFHNFDELSDTFTFIKNMCKNIKIINEEKCNLNSFNEECILLSNIYYEKVNDYSFLTKKRKNALYCDTLSQQCRSLGYNDKSTRTKRHPLKIKKNNKKISAKDKRINKIKNSKNGDYITAYLNQLKVDKTALKIFPLCPIPTLEENITVSFLEGIINEKYRIKFKKRINLIKDDRIFEHMKYKRFELKFQNDEKNLEFTVCVNHFNILFVIYYYYYKIKERIILINKYHYTHAAFSNIKREINVTIDLIKKCNIIVDEISK